MTPFPSGPNGSQLRIGDGERDAAVSALGEHYAAGRLTQEEYDERSGAAWSARTNAQLWPLFADLPPLVAPGTARPAARSGHGLAGHGSSAWPEQSRRPWWLRVGLTPVLLVVLAVVIFGHLHVVALVMISWFMLSRVRHWGRPRNQSRDRF